jgi:hypothetical protein
MHPAPSQRNLTEDLSPAFSAGRKLSEVAQALLWTLLQEDPGCPSRVLLDKVAQRQIPIAVRLRHVNRWRTTWGPYRTDGAITPHLPYLLGRQCFCVP